MKNFPKPNNSDYAYAVAKGIISAIPVAGGSLSVLLENIFSTPLDKRKKQWLISLAESIDKIKEKVDNITPESLSQDEAFISISLQATQIALRNHQKEKLEALKNAIINSKLDSSIDENKSLIYIRLIDELTPLHLKVLSFLNNPNIFEEELQSQKPKNIRTIYSENINIWDEYYPELRKDRDLILHIIEELKIRNFIYSHISLMGNGSCSTEFGQDFLKFISKS